jgi:hypothetical protein
MISEKAISITWNKYKINKDNYKLLEIENKSKEWNEKEVNTFFTKAQKEEIKCIEKNMRKILLNKETKWDLKNQSLYL